MLNKTGILETASLKYFPKAEYDIATYFAKDWLVTLDRHEQYKKSDFYFIFIKPTETLKAAYNFDRELLVVISPHKHFEFKTLDFIDKTLYSYQNRLDKLVVLLISRHPSINQIIANETSKNPDARIIIPFVYSDFSKGNTEAILEKIRSLFYERDLYDYSSPLRSDASFFGRSDTIQDLYNKYKNGENSGLFGLRRIGKTSVLYGLKRYLTLREEPSFFFDCQDTAFHFKRWNTLLKYISNIIADELRLPPGSILARKEKSYSEEQASEHFFSDIRTIYSSCGKKRILLIFDEIENITFDVSASEHWRSGRDYIFFWQTLRSIFQNNPEFFSFVIAGINPKCIESPTTCNFDNPIYRFINPTYLSFFDVKKVKEMVSSIGKYLGLTFDEEIFTHFVDDFGGHPFLIRQACSKIHKTIKARPTIITKFTYQSVRGEIETGLKDYLEMIVGVLRDRYNDEYEMLKLLALDESKHFNDLVKLSFEIIKHLHGYGLIVEDHGKYFFRIKSLKQHLLETHNLERALNTFDEKITHISKERNNLEKNMRKLVKVILQLNLGNSAKDALSDIVTDRQKRKFAHLSYSEIFESQKTEIYFLDLMKVISKHWSLFSNVYQDKHKFTNYMEIVNRFRIDAHAAEISDDDVVTTRHAISWLNEKTSPFI